MRIGRAGGIGVATVSLLVLGALPTSAEEQFDAGQWWMETMGVHEAHEQVTGDGVTIALLDGPVHTGAPELEGQDVVPSGSRCRAPDGAEGPAAGPASADTSHTTAMAALLVGNGRGTRADGRGTSGIAPDTTLRTYAVYDYSQGDLEEQDLVCRHGERLDAEFLREVLADDPDIVVGTTGWWPSVQDVIDEGIEDGVVFVNSAGNTGPRGSIADLGTMHGVVNVVAGDRDGGYAEFNSAPAGTLYYLTEDGVPTPDPEEAVMIAPDHGGDGRPTIFAAGVDITTGGYHEGRWESDVMSSGTSGAAGLVAGALALTMERWPDASGNQVLQSMVRNANGDFPLGYDPYYGFGGLSLPSLLEQDPGQYPDVHPFYGGLRWALEPDPPAPVMPEADEDGIHRPWRPTYAPDELDLPYPWGPAFPPETPSPAPVTPSASPTVGADVTEDDGSDESASAGAASGGPPWWITGGTALVALLAGAGLWGRHRHQQRGRTGSGPIFATEAEGV